MKSVLANVLAFCVFHLVLGSGQLAAQIPPAAALPPAQVPETWLMLKNGSTFSARMLSAGERVRLRVNDGDIEIRASEIALTGYSLSDLAEQQWALLHQQQLDKQFPFVDWCTRHHLYDYADAALSQMALAGNDTQRIKGYQTHLARLRQIHAEQLALAAAPAAAPPPQQSTSQQPITQPLAAVTPPTLPLAAVPAPVAPSPASLLLPSTAMPPAPALTPAVPTGTVPATVSSPVQQAAYQPLEMLRTPSAISKEPTLTSPNVGTLSPAAVELFASRVQPWVVSRCSNSGCHDMNSTNSFKLERYSKQEAIPRATTLKNMAATARLIDLHKPSESPLLTMATRPHGSSLAPPLAQGDAPAMAAFREFVALATGRELPKETKPDAAGTTALGDLPGQVTPGRATFPASAADEPALEDKAAKLLKQTGPGWQAAIERQRAIDLETQRLKELENNSQRANETRGLIVDPAVQPTAVAAEAPIVLTPMPTQQPAALSNLPAGTPLFDNDAAKAAIANQSSAAVIPAVPRAESPTVIRPTNLPLPQLSDALPESLLPKSLAPPTRSNPASAESSSLPEVSPSVATPLAPSTAATAKAPPKIDLKRPRRMFPLPPEDAPPPKAVGTGEAKRR